MQEAAGDPRVTTVIAAETFSDLRTVARERAPEILPEWTIRRAFVLAQRRGSFDVDLVSPLAAAALITVPVLVIHGAADRETSPDHSRRVYDALTRTKRLIMVEGTGHNHSLRADVWPEIDAWVDDALDARKHL